MNEGKKNRRRSTCGQHRSTHAGDTTLSRKIMRCGAIIMRVRGRWGKQRQRRQVHPQHFVQLFLTLHVSPNSSRQWRFASNLWWSCSGLLLVTANLNPGFTSDRGNKKHVCSISQACWNDDVCRRACTDANADVRVRVLVADAHARRAGGRRSCNTHIPDYYTLP